jgi:hypothetical protein
LVAAAGCVSAGLASCVPLLNWVTTGDHPLRALGRGASAVAGMDLMLLVLAGSALVAAPRLSREQRAPAPSAARLAVLGEPEHEVAGG